MNWKEEPYEEELLGRAVVIANTAFVHDQEKLWHSEQVAFSSKDTNEQIVGYLHDIVEDTSTTIEELKSRFPDYITDAVELLTRKPEQRYFDYIRELIDSGNGLAIKVKYYDLKHNRKRCIKSSNKRTLLERYDRALKMISEHIKD